MNKTIKMFNGDIREFETNKQYQKVLTRIRYQKT